MCTGEALVADRTTSGNDGGGRTGGGGMVLDSGGREGSGREIPELNVILNRVINSRVESDRVR